jgi:hypothetical protein
MIKRKKILSDKGVENLISTISNCNTINVPANDSHMWSFFYKPEDKPENSLERYLSLFPSIFDIKEKIYGYEWWYRSLPEDQKSKPFHFDCDEELRVNKGFYKSPLLTTITYLTDDGAPTIVNNIQVENNNVSSEYNKISLCPPKTGYIASFPAKNAHGVVVPENPTNNRKALIVNVWTDCLNGELFRYNVKDDLIIETLNNDWEMPPETTLENYPKEWCEIDNYSFRQPFDLPQDQYVTFNTDNELVEYEK